VTPRQRVAAALEHRTVRPVPYDVHFTAGARRKMAEFYGDADFTGKLGNCCPSVAVLRVEFGVRGPDGFYTDEFGTRWNRSIDEDIGIPAPLVTPENLRAWRLPDPAVAGRFDALLRARRARPDLFLLMNMDFSLFERAWALVGMEDFLVAMIADRPFAEAVLDRILEFNLEVIRLGIAACPEVDGVRFGDDFGTQNGLMMGPAPWRALLKPRLARQYAAVKSRGKKVFIHSCGKVDDIFEDLAEIGVDCFNPFQPEVTDVFAVKRRFRGRMGFFGGISTQQLLPYGSPAQVREEVSRLLAELGEGGGYIAAPAHSIPGDAPAENIHAMLEVLRAQGPEAPRPEK